MAILVHFCFLRLKIGAHPDLRQPRLRCSELTLRFSVWIRLPHLALLFHRRWLVPVHAHEGRSSRNGCQGPKDGRGKAAPISGNASGTRGRGPLSLHPHRGCCFRLG